MVAWFGFTPCLLIVGIVITPAVWPVPAWVVVITLSSGGVVPEPRFGRLWRCGSLRPTLVYGSGAVAVYAADESLLPRVAMGT